MSQLKPFSECDHKEQFTVGKCLMLKLEELVIEINQSHLICLMLEHRLRFLM